LAILAVIAVLGAGTSGARPGVRTLLRKGRPGRVQRDRDGLFLRLPGRHFRADVLRNGCPGVAFVQGHYSGFGKIDGLVIGP
jgi:hypothetical protein